MIYCVYHACASVQDVCYFQACCAPLSFSVHEGNRLAVGSVPVAIVSVSLMDSSHPVSFSSLFLPILFFHIISMYSPRGWLKGFLAGVQGEEMQGGGLWRRVVLITPYVWTGECGVEVLFQLINRDTVVLQCLCLSFFLSRSFPVSSSLHPLTLPLEIMCLLLIL